MAQRIGNSPSAGGDVWAGSPGNWPGYDKRNREILKEKIMNRLIALHEASHIVIALTLKPLMAAQLTHYGDYYEVTYTEDYQATSVECGMIILAGKAIEHLHGFNPVIDGSHDGNTFDELGFDANESQRIWQDTLVMVKEHYKRIAKLASQLQKIY